MPLSKSFMDMTKEPAAAFLAAVDAVAAERPRQGLAILDSYVGVGSNWDERQSQIRCRSLAAVAPLIACVGLMELNPGQGIWGFDIDLLDDDCRGPADIAALRVIVASLNGDGDAALDIREALFATGGFDALVDLVVSTLRICVALKHQGAFVTAPWPPTVK